MLLGQGRTFGGVGWGKKGVTNDRRNDNKNDAPTRHTGYGDSVRDTRMDQVQEIRKEEIEMTENRPKNYPYPNASVPEIYYKKIKHYRLYGLPKPKEGYFYARVTARTVLFGKWAHIAEFPLIP